MKNRKALKGRHSRLESILFLLFLVFSIIAVFIGFYLLSSRTIFKPSTKKQLDFYEEVARNVYEQNEEAINKVIDKVSITRGKNTINVSDNYQHGITSGRVVLIINNDGIIIERHPEFFFSLFMNILFSTVFTIDTCILLFLICYYFWQKKCQK